MNKHRSLGRQLLGVGVTIILTLVAYTFNIPNPMLLCFIGVVYATFIGGYCSGSISCLLSIGYAYVFFASYLQPLQYTHENLQKLIIIQMVMPVIVVLVGRLKRKVERQIIQLEEGKIRLQAEYEERLLLQKELAKMSRLDLIGQMAAGIGHEIRNPIQTVRGFMQLLQQKNENCACQEYYPLLISELDRANAIISEYLSLASNKMLDLNWQNINDIVSNLAPLLIADANSASCQLELKLGHISSTYVDEHEIRQLILNLTRNGLEACSAHGVITITTYTNTDHSVVLSVADTGTGIPKEIMTQVGVPFFTTKDHGTGLGLAVCYSIANRHNAAISIASGAQGTNVEVVFAAPGKPSPK